MDREKIYSEWQNKIIDGAALCNKQTIAKCRKISDANFEYFVDYQNYLLSSKQNIGSLRQRRSKIIDFLISKEIRDCDLRNISQEMVESYFYSKLGDKSDSTYMTRVNYISGFLEFVSKRTTISIKLDELRLKSDEMQVSKKHVKKALSAKQLSLCRSRYKDEPRKLYIFEMLYYTGLTKEQIKKIKFEDIDFVDCSINTEKKISIPQSLINLISDMHRQGLFNQPYDIDTCIDQMKVELQEYGIDNFKPKDMKETKKVMHWRCPQCGKNYEAIADNWCIYQYTNTGKYWIVCREKCGNE